MQETNPTTNYRDPDTFDVRGAIQSILQATRQHKLLVVMCCLVTLGITVWYVRVFPPTYIAIARVLTEKPIDNNRDNFYTDWNIFRKDDPRTEAELMTSPAIVAEAVKKEGLKYDDVYHPLLSHLSYVWKQSRPGKFYQGIKDRMVPKVTDPLAPSPEDIELARVVTDLKKGIKITAVADSDIQEIVVKGPNRRVAQLANTLMDIYMARRLERYRTEAQRNFEALDKEVEVAAQEAEQLADERLAFSQKHNLAFDLAKEQQQQTKIVEIEDGIYRSRARVASLEASLREIDSLLQKEPETKIASTVTELNTVREAAKGKLLDLKTSLITARAIYKEDAPEVQDIVRNIKALEALIAAEPERLDKAATTALNSVRQDLITAQNTVKADLEGTRGGLTTMEDTDRGMRERQAEIPVLQNILRDNDRHYALVNDRYNALSAKRAQAAVSRAMSLSATPSLSIVQQAEAPDDPSWPIYKYLFPSALFVGLLLGVTGAQIRSLTSGRVRREDLERANGPSPIYATIRIPLRNPPFVTAASRRDGNSDGSKT